MNKVLYKDTVRTIGRTSSRFFSIVLIVALGISFFAGMNATAPDMLETAHSYYVSSNAADIRIISTAGLSDEDAEVIKSIDGVEGVCSEKFVDGVVDVDGEAITDLDGSRFTVRAHSIDINKAVAAANGEDDRSFINRPQLVEGSWPTSANECLVDESTLSTPEQFKIGSVITLESYGNDITNSISNTEFTICGIIRTPLYISYQRGNTTIGTGKLGSFIYIPSENFINDYYSALSIKIAGSDNYDPYSDEYESYIEPYLTYINSISQERISARVNALKPTYSKKVAEGEEEYAKTKADVDQQIAQGQETVNTILDMAENGDEKLAEYKRQYNEKAVEAQNAIGDSKLEHSTQYANWEQKRQAYNEAKAMVDKYATAETDYKNAVTEYNVANTAVNTLSSTVDYLESLVATTRAAVDQLNSTQGATVGDIINRFEQSGIVGEEVDKIIASVNSLTAVGTAEEISAYMEPELQNLEEKLASAKKQLSDAKTELANKKAQLDKAAELVEQLKEVRASLSEAEVALDEAEKELTSAGYDIQLGELEVISQLSDLKNQITNYETNLQLAKEKANTIEAEFEQTKAEAYAKLDDAKSKLDEANNFLLSLDNAKWYVNDRNGALLGFEEYGQTAERTKALSLVFPWFFFIVAALVSLNSMTRMVEDERTQLGTLKAMGFHNGEIVKKYVFYSFFASFIGAFAGSFLGFAVFPTAVTACYTILFDMPSVIISYRLDLAAIGVAISVGVTVLSTYFSAQKSLKTHPSTLMKPRAPKGGKHIFLERFPFLWSHLSFTSKVTFRNVFRNKKRFVMAVIGVMGCTALLVSAFGLDNSINAAIENQFTSEDRILSYDMQVVLNGEYDTTITECTALQTVSDRKEIGNTMLEYMKSCISTSDKSEKEMETYILVPEDASQLSNYIHVRDVSTGEEITLPQNGCVITEKLSKRLNIGVGDSIKVSLDDGNTISVPVAAVAKNYTFHYMYMAKEVYQYYFGANPRYNYITANFSRELEGEEKTELSSDLMQEYEISAVSYSDELQQTFENTFDSIKSMVVILIVCAGLLCVIVLYNLSIININERVKEIATLKVLGFNHREVNSYIFRENVMLSVFGTFLGLFLGKL
ncbi:MAG: FtsX-like permease family protein, partial [Acutalibacteraceae bacterium]